MSDLAREFRARVGREMGTVGPGPRTPVVKTGEGEDGVAPESWTPKLARKRAEEVFRWERSDAGSTGSSSWRRCG
jgi:hypothetical protein